MSQKSATFANLIIRSGLSMSQIARESGVSLATVSKVAAGTRTPSVRVALQLSVVMGCTWVDIIQSTMKEAA